jgi:mannose-6-phosphate isomerase-like protein (cupin superfamily)
MKELLMSFRRLALTSAALLACLPLVLSAQEGKILYYPKPTPRPAYKPPMKPITHLADLKAKHKGKTSWREPIIDDGNSVAFMIQDPPGTKIERKLYPDSAAWWAVLEGRVRFEIEKADGSFDIIDASKGSFVFAPERLLHSLEVVGNGPAIRYEVTSGPSSTPVYEKRPAEAPKGTEYIPVTLSTGPNPLDVRNEGMSNGKPWPNHLNVYELAKQNESKKGFTQEAMRANRARGNFICGYRPERQPTDSGDRGHLHTDTAESWIIMLGELRWVFDGDEKTAVVARQGDIIYAVPGTFHSPQFWGKEGLNCRLTSSTYPSANHFYDPAR